MINAVFAAGGPLLQINAADLAVRGRPKTGEEKTQAISMRTNIENGQALAQGNAEIHRLLKDGVRVQVTDSERGGQKCTLKVDAA